MLSEPHSSVRITTKWDGVQSIVCGIDPMTGYFFVGNKSVFNKELLKVCITQNLMIDDYYTGGVDYYTKTCLKYLPKLGITGVVQGDFLFTNNKNQ